MKYLMAGALKIKDDFQCIKTAFPLNLLTLAVLLILMPIGESRGETQSDGASVSKEEALEFDADLLIGDQNRNKDLSRFTQKNRIEPGLYLADIYINDVYITRQSVALTSTPEGQILPCLTPALISESGLRFSQPLPSTADGCLLPGRDLAGASAGFELSIQKLSITIPKALLEKETLAIPVEQLSSGESGLFTSYDANYYYSHANSSQSQSGYLYLNNGLNVGLWQFRSQSNATYSKRNQQDPILKTQFTRTYLQRPVTALGSQLTLGENWTSGDGFGGLRYIGVKLQTDERMKPKQARGYAPVIRGIAETTAKVTLRQRGQLIHQATVPPGNFEIDNLPATPYQGDIDVEVEEADGRVSSFVVPYAAVPDSLREGSAQTTFMAGQATQTQSTSAFFSDLLWRKGISNATTVNTGLRVSDHYRAVLGGVVYNSRLGAFGFNTVSSQTRIADESLSGWRLASTWSRTFDSTGTTFSLAGYRYSTQGYRELNDVLGLRKAARDGKKWQSDSYGQRSYVTLTLNQYLASYGNLWLSASQSRFHQDNGKDMSLQLGYSHHWRSISYNFSLSQQYSGTRHYGLVDSESPSRAATEKVAMFSLSIPLSSSPRAPTYSTSVNVSRGNQHSTGLTQNLSGTMGENRQTGYNLNAKGDQQTPMESLSGSLTHQFPAVATSATLSKSQSFVQGGLNVRGSAVFHDGGVTLGPYLGDTFALVEAKNAKGARISNGMGAVIDDAGYAIYPSLTPYQFNAIQLDAANIEDDFVELEENHKNVAAYAGAMVKVKFKTRKGYPLLIKLPQGESIPLGEDVMNEKNDVVGMIGQGNQIYARVENRKGLLFVRSRPDCAIPYDLSAHAENSSLFRLNASCSRDIHQ